jgi:hypothetical protein
MTLLHLQEKDLHRLGLTVQGDEAVPLTGQPAKDWPLDRLLLYGKGELAHLGQCNTDIRDLARRSALHLFRAGHAFFFLREIKKAEETWMTWLRDEKLPHSTVLQAIQLYERAESEEAIQGLTITEAKEKFKIVQTKPTGQTATRRSAAGSRRTSSTGGSHAERHEAGEGVNGDLLDERDAQCEERADLLAEAAANGTAVSDDQYIDSQDVPTVLHKIGTLLDLQTERVRQGVVVDLKVALEAADRVVESAEGFRSAIRPAQ